jgi:Family of unknown function (DUF6006)
MKRNLSALIIGATLFATTLTAHASTVAPGWWSGSWQCTIDGRPARMKWSVVDVGGTSCDGEVCTSTSEVAWRGRFSDNGSQWVSLTNARPGRSGGLYFNHADGNKWYLPRPTANRTKGWTTWQGNRYPLSCWR